MQFKKLMLVFASLILVAFSFNFAKASNTSASIQSKSIHWAIVAVNDVNEDDFDDVDLQILHCAGFGYIILSEESEVINSFIAVDSALRAIPRYLQVRNFRI